jgi:hypothetical protein
MIDRLEIGVPWHTPGNHAFWSTHVQQRASSKSRYRWFIDASREMHVRIYGGHKTPTSSDNRYFKIEFSKMKTLTADDLTSTMQRLFETSHDNILAFRVMRLDFAADVRGVSVEWFKQNCRVRSKRINGAYESPHEEARNRTETLYFGAHTDLYRIYNKVAEKRARGGELGFWPWDTGSRVVTRIERQCTGRAVPKKVSTFGKFLCNAVGCDPFDRLICAENTDIPPSTDDWEPRRWLMNLGLARAVQLHGEATVRARLNRTRNAKRFFDQYSDLLRSGAPGPSRKDLVTIYRGSTRKQLNIPERDENGDLIYPLGGRSWNL